MLFPPLFRLLPSTLCVLNVFSSKHFVFNQCVNSIERLGMNLIKIINRVIIEWSRRKSCAIFGKTFLAKISTWFQSVRFQSDPLPPTYCLDLVSFYSFVYIDPKVFVCVWSSSLFLSTFGYFSVCLVVVGGGVGGQCPILTHCTPAISVWRSVYQLTIATQFTSKTLLFPFTSAFLPLSHFDDRRLPSFAHPFIRTFKHGPPDTLSTIFLLLNSLVLIGGRSIDQFLVNIENLLSQIKFVVPNLWSKWALIHNLHVFTRPPTHWLQLFRPTIKTNRRCFLCDDSRPSVQSVCPATEHVDVFFLEAEKTLY